jgi:hypothetical protein
MPEAYTRLRTACEGACNEPGGYDDGEEYHDPRHPGRERSMTTAAPRNETPATLEELDERTQDAWAVYSDSLRDLTGRDYDEAESDAWDHLQRQLRELEGLRAELLAPHT